MNFSFHLLHAPRGMLTIHDDSNFTWKAQPYRERENKPVSFSGHFSKKKRRKIINFKWWSLLTSPRWSSEASFDVYQYSNMAPRLSGKDCKLSNFVLSLNFQKRIGKKRAPPKREVCPDRETPGILHVLNHFHRAQKTHEEGKNYFFCIFERWFE